MLFEIGDKVYINPPKNWNDFPTWTDVMDEEIDTDLEYTIDFISDSIIYVEGISWNFSPNWLELSKNNHIVITGPHAHVIKKIRQLDKRFEERHKGIKYDF